MRTSLFPLLLTMIGCDLVVETDTSGFDVSFSCDAPITLYFDADNDGYGGSTSTSDCIIPVGYVTIGGDCDDREPNSHPDADELCDDEDNDCDGTIDEDVIDAVTWYLDSDGDGYGDPDTTTTACDAPSGYVIDGTDCDDGSSVTHPGAAPRESLNPQGCYLDLDGDDYGDSSPPWGVSPGSDCADDPTAEVLAASINPSANEVVGDNLDNDCDGRELCFVDADGDGYRADAVSTVVSLIDLECSAEDGEATRSAPDGDCDDASAVTYPGAAFNDSATDCMRDADGDGYGDEAAAGAIIAGTDCLDTLSDSYPGAPEVFGDNIDNNCNGRNGGEISLRESRASIIGEAAYDYAGMGVSRAGDVDGDGNDDLFIGAFGEDSGGTSAGAAYLVLGPVSGEIDLSAADAKLIGEAAFDYAGAKLSAGDVDGDGNDDLFIGASGEDSGGDSAGAGYLLMGPVSGEIDLSAADAKLIGEEAYDNVGRAVGCAGDIDGDGNDDLFIGAPGEDSGGSSAGAAYLVLGPVSGAIDLSTADAKFIGEASGDTVGVSLSGAGDVDGDGHMDLLIGASGEDSGGTSAGAAYLLMGPVSGEIDLSAADAKLIGEEAYDNVGDTVSGVGDVNGDGNDDILISAHGDDSGATSAGAAYLVLGPVSGEIDLSAADAKFIGEEAYDILGGSVSGAGDVNGDGNDDLLLGAVGDDRGGSNAGAAYLVLGPVSGEIDLSAADAKLTGAAVGNAAGDFVGAAGDMDGDGNADVLITASGEDNRAGAVYLFIGADF